jgi:hypothetical protein
MTPPGSKSSILRETFTECLFILAAKYIIPSADNIQVSLMYVDRFVFFRFFFLFNFLKLIHKFGRTIDFQVMPERED